MGSQRNALGSRFLPCIEGALAEYDRRRNKGRHQQHGLGRKLEIEGSNYHYYYSNNEFPNLLLPIAFLLLRLDGLEHGLFHIGLKVAAGRVNKRIRAALLEF